MFVLDLINYVAYAIYGLALERLCHELSMPAGVGVNYVMCVNRITSAEFN